MRSAMSSNALPCPPVTTRWGFERPRVAPGDVGVSWRADPLHGLDSGGSHVICRRTRQTGKAIELGHELGGIVDGLEHKAELRSRIATGRRS